MSFLSSFSQDLNHVDRTPADAHREKGAQKAYVHCAGPI